VIVENVPLRDADVRNWNTSPSAGLKPASRSTASVPSSVAAPLTARTS
jgi:hypothetical protein